MWDLRGKTDEYLGGIDLRGRGVLEIGPASGCLTVEMERAGADVTAIELPPEASWDVVP
jgi:O-methyltransferase